MDLHSGGRSKALAMSTLFTMFVLIPLPRPSICTVHKHGDIGDDAGKTASARLHIRAHDCTWTWIHSSSYLGHQFWHLVPVDVRT